MVIFICFLIYIYPRELQFPSLTTIYVLLSSNQYRKVTFKAVLSENIAKIMKISKDEMQVEVHALIPSRNGQNYVRTAVMEER